MLKDSFFRILLAVLISIAALHFWGLYGGGYKNIIVLDVVTHFLGGAFIGGMAVWLLRKRERYAYGIGILAALAIGISWEIFEIITDPFLTNEAGYAVDTVKDLIMDTLGGLSAAYLFLWIKKNSKPQ